MPTRWFNVPQESEPDPLTGGEEVYPAHVDGLQSTGFQIQGSPRYVVKVSASESELNDLESINQVSALPDSAANNYLEAAGLDISVTEMNERFSIK